MSEGTLESGGFIFALKSLKGHSSTAFLQIYNNAINVLMSNNNNNNSNNNSENDDIRCCVGEALLELGTDIAKRGKLSGEMIDALARVLFAVLSVILNRRVDGKDAVNGVSFDDSITLSFVRMPSKLSKRAYVPLRTKTRKPGEERSDEPFEHPQGQPQSIFEHPVGGTTRCEVTERRAIG